MIAYDIRHVPPAAVVQVMIASVVHAHRRARVSALLDTGSDVTAILRTLVERLQLYPISRLEIEGLEAITTSVFSYAVQLSVAGLVISRLEVVLTGLDFVVLGRDVLNHLYVLLNGPDVAVVSSANRASLPPGQVLLLLLVIGASVWYHRASDTRKDG